MKIKKELSLLSLALHRELPLYGMLRYPATNGAIMRREPETARVP